ncbi:hypothetical protein VIGAN_05190800 [Vigna angularis var. angularis]|uniref:Uncharacterized protein n=1 Tax=Vigna angularis var. angularis TaxID=157739 RepID=A0A0S3S6I9_PHAAN|nr:hypothetical protein VIGAN_05190800 [Vigna angularis var. angularis]
MREDHFKACWMPSWWCSLQAIVDAASFLQGWWMEDDQMLERVKACCCVLGVAFCFCCQLLDALKLAGILLYREGGCTSSLLHTLQLPCQP